MTSFAHRIQRPNWSLDVTYSGITEVDPVGYPYMYRSDASLSSVAAFTFDEVFSQDENTWTRLIHRQLDGNTPFRPDSWQQLRVGQKFPESPSNPDDEDLMYVYRGAGTGSSTPLNSRLLAYSETSERNDDPEITDWFPRTMLRIFPGTAQPGIYCALQRGFDELETINLTWEQRSLAVTNLRFERPSVNVNSPDPFVRVFGDITVYPNQHDTGIAGWKPIDDIHWRVTLKSPLLAPENWVKLDGIIPYSEISTPDSYGIVASFEAEWDGFMSGLNYDCRIELTTDARVLVNVEGGGNALGGAANTAKVLLESCPSLALNGNVQLSLEVPVFSGPFSGITPSMSYSASNSSALPASMGYGWSSTESSKVYELDDDSLVYSDESSNYSRWLKDGSVYTPLTTDNKLLIEKDAGSTSARFIVRWRDGSRREFDEDGRLSKDVSSNGQETSYDRQPTYLAVSDGRGRTVYHHFNTGEVQPYVINDSIDPDEGCRTVFEYYGSGDPAPDRLKSITNPVGDKTLFVYNSEGQLVEHRDVRPTEGDRSVFYTYSNVGGLVRMATMRVSSSKYDPVLDENVELELYKVTNSYSVPFTLGSKTYITTKILSEDLLDTSNSNREMYIAYDARSRVIAQFQLLELDDNDDPIYLETYHEYEDENDPFLRTATIAPNGAITRWEYTDRGNIKRILDAQLNETLLSYVEEEPLHPAYSTFPDLVTEIRRPAPDLANAPTVFFPPTKFDYNPLTGNLVSVEDPAGGLTTFDHNADGQVIEVINRRGFKTLMGYDVRGNLVNVSVQKSLDPEDDDPVADFRTAILGYDANDHLVSVEDPSGNTVSIVNDDIGRPITFVDSNLVEVVLDYVDGVLKQVTLPENNAPNPIDPNIRISKIEYDSAGRPLRVTREDNYNSAQLRVGFAYDGFSQLRSLVRLKHLGRPEEAEFSHTSDYDRQGRPVSSTDPQGKTSSAAYQPYCVGYAATSAGGVRRSASFDNLCRLTQIEVGSPDPLDPLEVTSARETRTYDYDDLGRVVGTTQKTPPIYGQAVLGTSIYGGQSSERGYEYDSLDRLEKVTFEDGKTMEYFYDDEGNVIKVVENASGSSKETQFSYYGDNRLYQVTYVRSGGNHIFEYAYDPGGRPLTLTYPSSTGIVAFFSGPSSEPGWDGNGQLLHLRYMKGSDTIRRFEFSYDNAGNRLSQLDVVDIASPSTQRAVYWEYGYDWLDRLETVKKKEATTVSGLSAVSLQLTSVYQYDASDNRVEFQVPNLDPDLTETFSYSYDDADNIASVSKAIGAGTSSPIFSFTSDDDGNLKTKTDLNSEVVTLYKWDDFNRLAYIETRLNGNPTGTIKQTNVFGMSGFRRKKKDKDGVVTTEYATGLATAVSQATGGDTITYLMGHRMMGFEKSGDFYWFICDALSTVRDVVDSSGDVKASYEFSEYGQRIAASESGTTSQKTWVGGLSVQDEIAETGLMVMGHRVYEPNDLGGGTGRFLNRDPVGYRGGLNLFEYVGSRPNQLTDAQGLELGISISEYAEWSKAGAPEKPLTPEEQQQVAEFVLGFNPYVGFMLSVRDFAENPSGMNLAMLGLSTLGLRSAINAARGARAVRAGYGFRRAAERGALGGGLPATRGVCTSVSQIRRALSLSSDVWVASRQLASEYLRQFHLGGTPMVGGGITNTTGWATIEVSNWLDEAKGWIHYHWDEAFEIYEKPGPYKGTKVLKNHNPANPHAYEPHLQIETDSWKQRLFYPESTIP